MRCRQELRGQRHLFPRTWSANEGVKARIVELKGRNAEKCDGVSAGSSILGGDSENAHRRSNRRSAPGAVLRRKEQQGRTPQQARRDAAACQEVRLEEPEQHEFEHGFKEKQELVEVIARLRGRGAARDNQCAE